MFTAKGKFGWYELMTSDTKAAGKFYSDVVGWQTQEMPSEGGTTYTIFNAGGVGMAGMMELQQHVSWVGYISVDDVDAHVVEIQKAGGKLWRPATDVPGMLRFAVMSDPQGAAIVVFTPNPAMPSPERPVPPAAGTIGWHELYTTDIDAGFEFYEKMFGWTKLGDMDMGPMGTYRMFDQGDHKQMGDGGMMLKGPQAPVAHWAFYFCVDAIDAAVSRVEAGGGKVLHGPTQVPGGGWVITGQDPQGAMFWLVAGER